MNQTITPVSMQMDTIKKINQEFEIQSIVARENRKAYLEQKKQTGKITEKELKELNWYKSVDVAMKAVNDLETGAKIEFVG